jgi:peptidoglycan hydrolase-like protein with peptidoglycan-binding domain
MLGSEGEDVLELQKILNSDSRTTIATEGAGSPGNETLFFGQRTKDAVIRFQNVYATQILSPIGLSQGTGVVGQRTIVFLNSMMSAQTSPVIQNSQSPEPQTSPSTPVANKKVPEFLVDRTITKADTNLHVGSQRDLSEIDFYLDDTLMLKRCFSVYTCNVRIHEDTKPGTYKLQTLDSSFGSYNITVMDSSEKSPRISFKSLKLNESNLIKGTNFSPNMTVYSMFGVFKTETKDNSFILEFPKDYVRNATTTTRGFFYVENENGLKSNILNINYEI